MKDQRNRARHRIALTLAIVGLTGGIILLLSPVPSDCSLMRAI
jgi:hypothetical protein